MALNLKTTNLIKEKITIRTIYVNTEDASSIQWEGQLQPYYEQLNNTNAEIKHQKANEYSQCKYRQDPTYHMYENNEQSIRDVLEEREINHLESKLPIQHSSKEHSVRHYKIGIGLLAAICVILFVILIAVAVTLSARSKCEGLGCLNNGICTEVDGIMKCQCLAAFSGLRCEVTPCHSSPCHNNGVCRVVENGYNCICLDGFTGPQCTDYTCDVEYTNGINCFLDQDIFSDSADWIRINGSTPTAGTGPSSAVEGNYYFYFDAYRGNSRTKARLISRRMNTGYIKCLTFNYHMYGDTMGSLYLYQDKSISTRISRNQGNWWHFGRKNIPSRVSRITFEARRGSSIHSDIAIDNITVTPGAC